MFVRGERRSRVYPAIRANVALPILACILVCGVERRRKSASEFVSFTSLRMRAVLLASLASAAAQTLPITSLPGLAVFPSFKMRGGYVNYYSEAQKSTHSTFIWIAESQGNPATDPILFWSA